MTPEQAMELGRRAVGCAGWRWLPNYGIHMLWKKHAQSAWKPSPSTPFPAIQKASTDGDLAVSRATLNTAGRERVANQGEKPIGVTVKARRARLRWLGQSENTERATKGERLHDATTSESAGTCFASPLSTIVSPMAESSDLTRFLASPVLMVAPVLITGTTTLTDGRTG